jgi:hypothetical protein
MKHINYINEWTSSSSNNTEYSYDEPTPEISEFVENVKQDI